jgi:hypothetical protein
MVWLLLLVPQGPAPVSAMPTHGSPTHGNRSGSGTGASVPDAVGAPGHVPGNLAPYEPGDGLGEPVQDRGIHIPEVNRTRSARAERADDIDRDGRSYAAIRSWRTPSNARKTASRDGS